MLNEYLDHPLNLELDSLRAALDKYQAGHAAQVSSLQLQRARLDASDTSARYRSLEAQNDSLKHEVALLRVNVEPSQTSRQVAELSLALRHVSDKLSVTENTLRERTLALTNAVSHNNRSQGELNLAHAEMDKLRHLVDNGHFREWQLRAQCRAAEEEARMTDVVVMEYADLVRSLEFRLSSSNATAADAHLETGPEDILTADVDVRFSQRNCLTPVDSLTQNRTALQRLLHEFNAETAYLQSEITRLHAEMSTIQMTLDAECEVSRLEREKLSEALFAIEHYKTEDASAGKMVSRYMQFSQSSIDTLQEAVETLKSRHAATLYTLATSSEALSHALDSERKRALQLRDILDRLTEDISRETFGRRREVLLRMKSLAREERLIESLRSWVGRAEGRVPQLSGSLISFKDDSSTMENVLPLTIYEQMLEEARCILRSTSYSKDETQDSPLGKLLLAEHICAALTSELQKETEKRLLLARTFASEMLNSSSPDHQLNHEVDNHLADTPYSISANENRDNSTPELNHHAGASQAGTLHRFIHRSDENLLVEVDPKDAQMDDIDAYVPACIAQSDHNAALEESGIFPSNGKNPGFSYLSAGDLSTITKRYDQIQRSFRDCHLALMQLKTLAASDSLSHRNMSLLQNVILRLDDYCEDARVELEIRIIDEARMAEGFETLLRIPAAVKDRQNETTRAEIQAFIDGTSPSVVKVLAFFNAKVTDLEHDIAQVKRALHELEIAPERRTPPIKRHWSSANLSSPPTTFHSPTPTFGSVITAPRPSPASSASVLSLLSPRDSHENEVKNPYAHLRLRIAMPSKAPLHSANVGSPKHASASTIRVTRSSSVYLLGLSGSGRGTFSSPAFFKPKDQGDGYGSELDKGRSDIE